MVVRCGAVAALSLLFVPYSLAAAQAQDAVTQDAVAQDAVDSGLDAATLASLREAAARGERAGIIAAVAQAIAARPDRAPNIVAEASRLSPQYRDAIVAVAAAQLPEREAAIRQAAGTAAPVAAPVVAAPVTTPP